MADTLSVKLITPTRKLYEAEAVNIIAPGANGEFGILPGHDPWMVALGMGPLVIHTPQGDTERFFTNGGFCQIDEDNVVILAEVCESALDIDTQRAEAAKTRAEERIIIAPKDDSINLMRAEVALRRALYRLNIVDD